MYLPNSRRLVRLCPVLFLLAATVVFIHFRQTYREDLAINESSKEDLSTAIEAPLPAEVYNTEMDLEKTDWQDEEFVRMESERTGNGERGSAATFPPGYDRNVCDEIGVFKSYGYNGCLSDYISVNRSLWDTRPKDCQGMKYRRNLPRASIIIPVYDERWSVLLRAIYSILNRSPPELIEEVILVDDGSTIVEMKQQLDDFVASNLPSKVRVLRAPRSGLMMARMRGARNATGEVLVFLDSNLEVNVNWLPPLLDLIVENERICVCPVIDVIVAQTFMIARVTRGFRGAFDWELNYRYFPVLPQDQMNPTKPFKNPVMTGCAFAIASRFFWELGGYDTDLQIYGGEQFELSFKVWQCGGTLIDVPCSRVAHLFRKDKVLQSGNYMSRNFKRIAEVWMDEFAEYVYQHKPEMRSIDPGNLSEQIKIREQLKCKPFKWFLKEVAFEVLGRFPLVDPPHYGSGKIKAFVDNKLCLTVINNERTELQSCRATDSIECRQGFLLSFHKDIEIPAANPKSCLTVSNQDLNRLVTIKACNREMTTQLWRYDLDTLQFVFGRDGQRCLTHDADPTKIYLKDCDEATSTQKWLIDSVNRDALAKWERTEPLIN